MEDSRLNAIKQLITFLKGRLNVSCKSTTAANVNLTESLLDNWLKNNHISVDKIYYLGSLFVFLWILVFKFYFSTAENRQKNRILLQLTKIRLEWIIQSNGSIGRPLGFVSDRLNTSASLYRIALCLNVIVLNSMFCMNCICLLILYYRSIKPGRFYARYAKNSSLYREYRYIKDRYIGVLSHTFYCNFCRDKAYFYIVIPGISLYRGLLYRRSTVGSPWMATVDSLHLNWQLHS